jgi:uncharacterized protein with GYD domain
MPMYITILRWTQQGIQDINESPARLDRAREAIKAAGGELKAFYLTMGQYDAVTISEAPNDEAYARALLALGSAGAVRTETLRAFPEEDYRKLIAALP